MYAGDPFSNPQLEIQPCDSGVRAFPGTYFSSLAMAAHGAFKLTLFESWLQDRSFFTPESTAFKVMLADDTHTHALSLSHCKYD